MMDPYTFKSSFPRDLTKPSTEQPEVCSPCIQTDSFAASFPSITTDFKLDYFMVTVANMTTNCHSTHETLSVYKQKI